MSASRTHPLRWWVRVVAVGLLGFAVVLMHSLVAGTSDASGGHHGMSSAVAAPTSTTHGDSHSSAPGASHMVSAASASDHQQMSGGDCMLGHHCTFVRGDDVPLPVIVLVAVLWGILTLPGLIDQWPGAVRLLGRPPPWTMPTHLTLAVIRC